MQAWINGSLTAPAVPVKLSGMAKPYTPTQYRKAFTGRVKAARTVSGLSPLETAEKLGIPKDTYHRYETRTLLPHHLRERFCTLMGCDLVWLITGARLRPDAASGAFPAHGGN